MKKIFTVVILLRIMNGALSQDRIVSFGYTKNFVSKDSTNLSIAVDVNRVPGKTESAGSFLFVNTPIGKSFFNFYLKPTADVNLGSYTSSAANNIAVGLPFGFAPKNPIKLKKGTIDISVEMSPDLIADKKLETYLYYFSPGFAVNYAVGQREANELNLGLGIKWGFGERLQNIKSKIKNDYRKFIIPIGMSTTLFYKKDKEFHKVKASGIFKYNKIIKDDQVITPKKDYSYFQMKIDYFFIKELGINISYTNGYEEPLFKKAHSISFGITLAR